MSDPKMPQDYEGPTAIRDEFEENIGALHRPPELPQRFVQQLGEPVPFSVKLAERRELAGETGAAAPFGYERPRVHVGHANIKGRV